MIISVIIPALNERDLIVAAIESAQIAGADEIIVCDGGSSDGTVQLTRDCDCQIVETEAGRGRQMATAAKSANGQLLVFLHADTKLGADCLNQIRNHVADPEQLTWGCFVHEISATGKKYRWLERGNAWRAKKRKMAYGDQVQWMTRRAYNEAGGYDPIPIMEDVRMSDSLGQLSEPIVLPGPVTIPPRHWQQKGVVRATVRNWFLFGLYRCGVSIERIERLYRR